MQQKGENHNYLFRKQVQLCLFMPGYHPKCWNIIESNKLHGFFFHGVIRIDARWCTWTAFTTHRYHLNNDTFIASGHWQNARVKVGFSSCVKYWNLQRERYDFSKLNCKYIQRNFYSFYVCPIFQCNSTVRFTSNYCYKYSGKCKHWFIVVYCNYLQFYIVISTANTCNFYTFYVCPIFHCTYLQCSQLKSKYHYITLFWCDKIIH